MKPKEGTILTVAKGASQKAAELAETTEDLDTFISEVSYLFLYHHPAPEIRSIH